MLNLESIKKEYEALLTQLSDPELVSDWGKFEKLTKRKGLYDKILGQGREIEDLKNRVEENKEILKSQEDQELSSLAETEIVQLKENLKKIEEELQALLRSSDTVGATAGAAVIVEIRAGAGGEEAALFAADLFRMYSKYSQLRGWKQKVLDSRPAELSGFKEIIFEITPHQGHGQGGDVWSLMKQEAGVHRVQRIPTTEKSGRVHTSTASVAILPKPKKGKIIINPHDLKMDTYKASGPGGQNVNKRMTAVRITHLPSGLSAASQTERSLPQNKENAFSILEAKILEKQIKKEEKELKEQRKTQIGKADRSEKIRTYNFPQNRITDHRIKKSFHNLEEIMEGKLDSIISALQKSKY